MGFVGPFQGPINSSCRMVRPAAQSAPSLKLWSVSDLRAAGRGRCPRLSYPRPFRAAGPSGLRNVQLQGQGFSLADPTPST
jgi:hypothetical protein